MYKRNECLEAALHEVATGKEPHSHARFRESRSLRSSSIPLLYVRMITDSWVSLLSPNEWLATVDDECSCQMPSEFGGRLSLWFSQG